MLCAEPKEHKTFSSGHPAGRIGDRDDRKSVYASNVYVLSWPPQKGGDCELWFP